MRKFEGQRNIFNTKPGETYWSKFIKVLKYRSIILPHEEWKTIWDFFIGILILYSVTVVPFRIGFRIEPDLKGFIFDIIVDIAFGLDMVFTFLTAYEDDGKVIKNHTLIAKHYLKTWFFPDFISTIPFDQILPALVNGVTPGALRTIKLIRALRLFRLLKLMRVSRLKRKMKEAKVYEYIHPIVYELSGLFTKIFLIAHLLACMYYYLSGCHKYNHSADVWMDCGNLGSLQSMYLVSLYWTMTTLLSVGYGDVVLTSNNGRVFSIFVMFIGSITFGFIVATVAESVKNWDPRETARKIKMEEVREYINEKSLPSTLQTKIWKHFEYYYNKLSTFPEDIILNSMPIMLQQLVLEKTRGDLSHFKLFHKEDYGTLSSILPHLKPCYLEPTMAIIHEGDYITDMYFVVHGCIHATINNIKTSNKLVLVGIYADGSDFGSSYALNCRNVSWADYRATVLTDLMWIGYNELQTIINQNDILMKLFQTHSQNELNSHKEVAENLSKTAEVNHMRIPPFIIIDGLVISCRNAIKMLGENTSREKAVKVYKVLYIKGHDDNGKDLYIEDQETTRQMLYRYIINPNAYYKLLFDIVVGLFALSSSIILPYRFGFGIPMSFSWNLFDIFTELIFTIDLIMSFFTAYEQSDYILNTVHKNIARRYIKSWFIIDVLSTIPFYRLANGQNSPDFLRLLKTLRIVKVIRIFRLLRLTRLAKLMRFVTYRTSNISSDYATIEDGVTRIGKLLAFMGFVTHLVACFWAWISLNSTGSTWSNSIGISNSEYGKKYIAAIYWAYYTMATVGYGDIPPMNDHERLYAVFTMILGSTILAYVVGIVSSYAFNKEGLRGLQEQKLNMVRDYLTEQGTPKTLKEAIIKHFCYSIETKTAFNEVILWNKLPHHCRLECICFIYRSSLEKLPMFHKIKDSIMIMIYMFMEPSFAVAETYVYNFETGSGGIYFILRGYAEVVDEDEQENEIIVANIFSGMFFGHEKLLGLTTDFIGIRSHTNLSMLYISDKNISILQNKLPLAYHALITLLQEACQSKGQEIIPSRYILPNTKDDTQPLPQEQFQQQQQQQQQQQEEEELLNENKSQQESQSQQQQQQQPLQDSSIPSTTVFPTVTQVNQPFTSSPQRIQTFAKRTITRGKSTVEDFFGWLGSDMDEGTWRQTSNLTHFKKKQLEHVKPSSTLSSNSKDRYRAMKADLRSGSTKIDSEDGDDDSSKNVPLRNRLLRSGRNSYANLYGTYTTSAKKESKEVSEVFSVDRDEHGPSPTHHARSQLLNLSSEDEKNDTISKGVNNNNSNSPNIGTSLTLGTGTSSGKFKVNTNTNDSGFSSLPTSHEKTRDSISKISKGLFQLTSFDYKPNRVIPTDGRENSYNPQSDVGE